MTIERRALFWLAAALLFAAFVTILAPVLLPFVIGLTLAYFFNPLADTLSRMGVPRWLSAVGILLSVVIVLSLATVFLVPLLAQQTGGLIETLPAEMARLRALLEEGARARFGDRYPAILEAVTRTLSGISESLPSIATAMAQSVWSQGQAAFNLLSLVLITPLVFFYGLLDWPKIVAKVDTWLPRRDAPYIRELASEIDSRVSAFIRGQGMVCLVLAAFYGLALSFLGLRYGLIVGVLTGLLSFVPFAGWALGLITATALAIVQFWPDTLSVLLVLGVFLAGQALDAALLSPQIVGSKIGLHPVWLIFALMTFSYLFGFLGLLVAVPVAAALGVVVRAALQSYMASSVYSGDV